LGALHFGRVLGHPIVFLVMKYKFPAALLLLLASLVIFDAFQQKYYMETFNLTTDPVDIYLLLQAHFIRWGIWIATSLPLGFLTWKLLRNTPDHISPQSTLRLVAISIASMTLTISMVSLQSMISLSSELALPVFSESFTFFTFQKSLIFLFANGLVILLIHRSIRSKYLIDQNATIHSLKRNEVELTAALQISSNQSPPQLEIKIGNKIKTVSTDEIVWIQADDYCVKIHTKDDQSFTIRKSMKALEKELSAFRFVRIHRGALLNLNYLDLIDTESSTVRLSNSDEITASKTGLRSLRKQVAI